MRFEPVLCDFDGTIADSLPVILGALRSACTELRLSVPSEADLRTCVGPPLERSLPLILGADAPVQNVIDSYRMHYMQVAPTQTRFMPDALSAIRAFHDSGIRVGVVSYKPLPLLEAIMEGMDLARYLSVVRAPTIGDPPESKTRLLLEAIDHLRPFRSEPLFIGDHDDDEQAAKEAAIEFIRYPERSWAEIREIVLGS
jgi:phosphoglycolate phosphatase